MGKLKILIVEDEAITAKDIEEQLNKLGYNVAGKVSSGKDAIKKAEQTLPDLILMDIGLDGDMDGIEAAKQIKTNFDIPVVYLTAYGDDETLKRARISEPFGYVIKPFEERDLAATIEIALYRNKLEQKVKESEEKYRNIFENIADIYCCADLEGKITLVNPAGIKAFGYDSLEEVVGKDLAKDIYYNPGDRKLFLEEMKIHGEVKNYELTLKRKDGTPIIVEANIHFIFDETGKPIGIEGLARNITNRKKAEEQIRETQLLLESSIESPKDMIILSIDKQYQYLYFNTAYKEVMTHAYRKHVKIGMNLLDCITDKNDREKSKVNFDRALSGESHSTIEKYGEIERNYYETLYNPIINKENEIIGATVFARNITERKKAEDERVKLLYKLC